MSQLIRRPLSRPFAAAAAVRLLQRCCASLALISLCANSGLGSNPAFAESSNSGVKAANPLLAAVPAETITIDTTGKSKPFPHFWEHMMGSGRAVLSMRESYRSDLRKCKENFDVQYVRFHAIFHDEVGLYNEEKDGTPVYNFSYIDQIYDGLVENGVRPFVEVSFMPKKLASREAMHAFWYHPNVAPPKEYKKWNDMVYAFADHLVKRYGIDEVSKWYFEIWNEPNLDFWGGKPPESTYYELYDESARTLKKVSPQIRVGGPATAQAAWVDRFLDHCIKGNVPVDFVSTHVYGDDTAKDVFGTSENIPRSDMVARAMKKVYDQVQAVKPGMPIIWSEYNATYQNLPRVTDSPFMGPWLANHIRQVDGLANEVSYWTFSDVFEEQGVCQKPFYGGYGLIAPESIPKAAFNAFKLLHLLGSERLPLESKSALATKRADGTLVLAAWNYAPAEEVGTPKTVRLDLAKLNIDKSRTAKIYRINKDVGSAYTAWQSMGSPDFPSREQLKTLRKSSELPPPEVRTLDATSGVVLELKMEPHELDLIEVLN